MKKEDVKSIDNITRVIYETLRGEMPEPVTLENLENEEIRQLTSYVNRWLGENEVMAKEILRLSNGYIDSSIECSFATGQSLKNLQATLKHLTWQARQVAEGDFSQRIELLGDFSESFNWMVSKLDANRKDLTQQNIDLQRLAATDVLTGVPNRRSFFELGNREFDRSKRYQNIISVFHMDIDFFKRINDRFGHAAGDEALKLMTRTSVEKLRSSDIFGRLGGEEFGVIILNADIDNAALLADRLRMEIAGTGLKYEKHKIRFTTSIGVATIGPEDENFDALLKRADMALYKAKKSGRNCVVRAKTSSRAPRTAVKSRKNPPGATSRM